MTETCEPVNLIDLEPPYYRFKELLFMKNYSVTKIVKLDGVALQEVILFKINKHE